MPSGYEDQTVDSIDFSSLSDEDLKKIAEEDERSTAQEKAQAELNRHEPSDDEEGATASSDRYPGGVDSTLYTNPEGVNLDPDYGQHELQARVDEMEEKGYFGEVTDPTPNENYSLRTPQDAPTPETDPELYEQARRRALGNPREAVDRNSLTVAKEKEANE